MLTIKVHNKFKKDLKLMIKRGYDENKLWDIVQTLVNEMPLPPKNRDHALSGDYLGCRECHIESDWLLVYEIQKNELLLILTRTGTHSDRNRQFFLRMNC